MRRSGGAGRFPHPRTLAMRAEVLRFLEDTAGRRNWAHKGLAVAIGHLSVDEACWTPMGDHSVWEQINHIAYWKRYILRRVQGARPAARQAWPAMGKTLAQLRRATSELAVLHQALRAAVITLDPDDLQAPRGRYPLIQLLLGEAAHESYHVGQIFLTRKMYRRRRALASRSGAAAGRENLVARRRAG